MTNLQINTYRLLFQFRSFRNFWLGFTLSVLGDTMTRVALTWFVYETTNSARALGWLTLFYTGPVIVGGLLAGWLLDRFNRQHVMIVDNFLRAAVVLLIPILYTWGLLMLWHIYLVAAVYGLLMMIPLAGGPALVPSLIPQQHLNTANALETLSYTLGGVIGPTLAGFLIARFGAPNVVIFDAISFLLFGWLLFYVTPLETNNLSVGKAVPHGYGLKDAISLLGHNKILHSTTLMYMSVNLALGAMLVWLPVYTDRILSGGPELYGVLLGGMAVGEVISSILAGSMVLPLSLGSLICLALLLAGGSLSILIWGQHLTWTVIGLALFGFFTAPLTIWAQTLRMRIIPEPLRGRTFALLRMLMQSANPLGGMLAGILLPILSLPAMVGISTLLTSLPGILGYRVKALRTAGEPHYGIESELETHKNQG